MASDGDGSAVISFNNTSGQEIEVPCGAMGTWTITYTVPEGGMAVGGGIKIFRMPNKYWLGQCKQVEDPKALDYLTTKRSDGGKIEISNIGRFYKDHNEARVVVKDTPMAAGTKIVLVFGDKSGGSKGAEVPYSWQPPCVYWVESDIDGDGKLEKLQPPLIIKPVASKVAKFVVSVPLISSAGEVVRLNIRAEDKGGNLDDRFKGGVDLSCTDSNAKFVKHLTFTEKDKGVKSIDVQFNSPGIHYITAKCPELNITSGSNPSQVTKDDPQYRIYWGDLHCHTEESDGTGSLEFNYEYARDVSWLDFIGVTDHLIWDAKGNPEVCTDGPVHRTLDEWNDIQSMKARKYNVPGWFVTFLAYEWSGGSGDGGDHNVYYLNDQTRVTCDPVLNNEYKDLESRGNEASFIIPHVGGRTADPKWHDPKVEPTVEINSMHGHFEWMGQDYMQKGFKMGFNGGSDGHFGLPGNDLWPNHGRLGMERRDTSVPQGTICTYASKLSREAVADGIYSRRTYATTGVKILLEVSMDGHMMGSDYSSDSAPQISILAAGTGNIGRIEIIRNQERIFNKKFNDKVVKFNFKDDEPTAGASYYYVRVSQNDGEIAWSSPIFFNYTGKSVIAKRKNVPWNYESESDELGDSVTHNYLPALQAHLDWRAPGRFYDLKEVRLVHNPRGDYALFYGYDKTNKGGKIHIRWYTGFDSERIHISRGWRDFGSERE